MTTFKIFLLNIPDQFNCKCSILQYYTLFFKIRIRPHYIKNWHGGLPKTFFSFDRTPPPSRHRTVHIALLLSAIALCLSRHLKTTLPTPRFFPSTIPHNNRVKAHYIIINLHYISNHPKYIRQYYLQKLRDYSSVYMKKYDRHGQQKTSARINLFATIQYSAALHHASPPPRLLHGGPLRL